MKDLPTQIKQLKSRKEFDSFWNLSQKQNNLQSMISELHKLDHISQQEVLKYIPVSIIAMLESLFRSCVKRLIDEKEECFENSKDILSEGKLKIGFDSFKYLHKREFSFGEFISHQVSCSNLEGINFTLSRLLYGDKTKKEFLSELKDFNPPTVDFGAALDSNDFRNGYESILKDVSKAFEVRHQICHEMSLNLKLTGEEVIGLYKSVHLLSNRIYEFVSYYIYPNAPMTQAEMMEVALDSYSKAEKELKDLLSTLRKNPNNYFDEMADMGMIMEAQFHWNKFMELYSEGLLAGLKGGSDYKVLILEDKAEMMRERIADLKIDFNLTPLN